MTRLIADIGGTNARFALVEPDGAVRDERHLLVRDYPDLAAAAEAYLGANRVSEAVIAVATPVETDEIGFTNSPWRFSISGPARLCSGPGRNQRFRGPGAGDAATRPHELEQMGGGTRRPGVRSSWVPAPGSACRPWCRARSAGRRCRPRAGTSRSHPATSARTRC